MKSGFEFDFILVSRDRLIAFLGGHHLPEVFFVLEEFKSCKSQGQEKKKITLFFIFTFLFKFFTVFQKIFKQRILGFLNGT